MGYSVGKGVLKDSQKRIYLATAHYAKFLNTVNKAIKSKIKYPKRLSRLFELDENFNLIDNDIGQLQDLIEKNSDC